jgi:hypothetical protein
MFDELANTGHQIGMRLRNQITESMASLWERANLPIDDPKRALPARCDQNWFLTTFCEGEQIQKGESAWQHVKKICVYDLLAMLACSPVHVERFFDPTTVVTNGTKHMIIGLSPKQSGVKNSGVLQLFITNSLLSILQE